MRAAVVIVLFLGCKGDQKKPAEAKPAATGPTAVEPAATKPADDMDEKMRHCPLALAGATVTLAEVADGVQFEVRASGATVDEVRKRARHVVEFAAGRSQAGAHGGGQGGGTMRNCPVVTNGVVIREDDIDGGAKLTIMPAVATGLDELRRETRARLDKFVFDGVTIERR